MPSCLRPREPEIRKSIIDETYHYMNSTPYLHTHNLTSPNTQKILLPIKLGTNKYKDLQEQETFARSTGVRKGQDA